MFEALLEKILQSKLGRYLNGLDEKNLNIGVWSGNVIIENVSLKSSVFDLFHFPLNLIFSSIGKISLKIPWKSLSSSPVEVLIENVYAVVSPKPEQDWKFTDYNKLNQKLELLDQYAAEIFEKLLMREKLLESKEATKKESSYMDKIALKVLDNLQITIKSIHVRMENPIKDCRFSFGVTLDFLSVHATNQNWEKAFIDRSDPQNADLPNYKILILNNLAVYWNSGETMFFGEEKNKKEIQAKLMSLIKIDEREVRGLDYLINIKAQLKSIQNSKTKFGPEFWFSLTMENIDCFFKKQQIRDIIKLSSFANKFKNAFDQNKKKLLKINASPEANQAIFMNFYSLWQIEKNPELFKIEDWNKFSEIVTTTPNEFLHDWTKQVMKNTHKDQNLKKKEIERKKASKKSFWSWGGGEESKEISPEEKSELELFYEKNFSDEIISLPIAKIKDPKFVDMEFEISLDSGSFSLILSKNNGNVEKTVFLQYKGLKSNIKKRENNKEVKFKLKEIGIEASMKTEGKKVFSKELLKRNDLIIAKKQNEDFFLSFSFEENPLDNENSEKKNEVKLDYSIELTMGSNKLIYDPIGIKWVRKFLDIDVEDRDMVEKTMKKLNQMNEDYQVALKEKIQSLPIVKLNIRMESPCLIIPLKALGRKDSSGCWFVNFGNFSFQTNEEILKKNISEETKIYDNFMVKLTEMRVIYFIDMDFMKKQLNEDKMNETMALPLVRDIFINVNLKKLNKNFQEIIKDKPETSIEIALNKLEIDFNGILFKEALFLQGYFTSEDRKEFQSKVVSRIKLNENSEKIGKVFKKRSLFQAWSEYFGILSKGNIYLYEKDSDLRYTSVIPVYNAILTPLKDQHENSYQLENSQKSYMIAFESENEAKSWSEAILKAQNQKDIKHELKMMKRKQQNVKKAEKLLSFLTLQIPEIKINMLQSFEMNNKWLSFSMKDLNSQLTINSLSNHFNFKISEITLSDEIHKYQNPLLKNLFTSVNPEKENSKELINIQIEKLDPKHDNYQNLDLDIRIIFGHFFINYKPLTLIEVMNFLKNGIKEAKSLAVESESDSEKLALKPQESLKDRPQSQQSEKIEERRNQIQKGTVLMKLHMKWETLSVSLNHYKTFLNVMELNLSKFDLFVVISDESLKVEGCLNDLTINDLSNYPKCLYREEEYPNIIKKEIFGKTEKNNDSILDFAYTQILSQEMIKNDIDSFVDVKIHSIKCEIYVQIIMNLVDYILIQIMGVINNPELLKSFKESTKKEINIEEMLNKIRHPKFMKLNVVMDNFLILLKPLPDSEEFFIIRLTKTEVTNKIIKSQKQIKNKETVMSIEQKPEKLLYLYNELYQVFLRDFVISVQRKGKPLKSLTSPLKFNLVYQGICFEQEYLNSYKNLDLDKTIFLRSLLRRSNFYLEKYDYDLILYLTFFNLTYEDEKSKVEVTKQDQDKTVSKIDFQLDIEEINFYGINSQLIKHNFQVPLFKIYFNSLRVNFQKTDSNEITVHGSKMDISHFEIVEGENFIQEISLLSKLAMVKKHGIEHNFFDFQDIKYDDVAFENKNAFGFSEVEFQENTAQLKTKVHLTPDGSKTISLTISDIKLLVHLGFFMNLMNFALFDDSIGGPPSNKDSNEKIEKRDKILNFSLNIQNVSLCIPISGTDECLTTRGQINFVFQTIDRDDSQKNHEKVIDEKNNVSRMNLHLPEFEIFKCNKTSLAKTDNVKLLSKRSIIEPISLFFNTKKYESVNQYNKKLRGISTILNLSQCTLKLSYKDLIEILKIINDEVEVLNKAKTVVFAGLKIKKDEIQNDIVAAVAASNLEEPPTESNIDFPIPNIQLIVINDLGISFSPFINFVIYESPFSLKIKQEGKDLEVLSELVLPISSSYYNAQINKWEPIIEKIHFLMDVRYDTKKKPNLIFNIENEISTANLNLNFSTEMMKSVLKGVKFIKESAIFDEKKGSQIQQSFINQEENNQYVSPYLISNKTGYPLEIRREININFAKSSEKKKKDLQESFLDKTYYVKNNSSINFQVENDETYFFSGSNAKTLTHYLRVTAEIKKDNANYKILNPINIQKTHLKENKVYGGKETLNIVTDVIFDAETNQKILTISSPIIMKNTTQKTIEIRFPSKPEPVLMTLIPGESNPVPFDLISGEMQIKFKENKEWSIPTLLSRISSSNASKLINILDNYLNIHSEQDNNFKTTLVFEPPFTFKNCLPVSLKLKLSFTDNDSPQKNNITENFDVVPLDPQGSYDICDIPLDTILFCQLTVPGFKTTGKTQINSSKVPEKFLFRIYDQKGWQQIVILNCHMRNNGARKFYFYANAYIINETYFNLYFFTNVDKRKQPIPGQQVAPTNKDINDKILLLSEETNILVSEQSNLGETSREIGLEMLNNTLAECYTKTGFIQTAMRMTMLCVDKDRYLYSKVISIIPRHVFANMTKYNIGLRQTGTDEILSLSTGQKKQYYWPDYKKTRYINMIIQENDIDFQNSKIVWMFSQDIDVSNLGITNLVIRKKDNLFAKKLFKLEIINEEGLIFIMIKEYSENYGPFLIKNSLDNVSIFFKQETPPKASIDFQFDRLDPKSQAIFSWDFPMSDKALLAFFASDIHEKMKSPLKLNTLNNINETYQHVMMPKNKKEDPLIIIVVISLFQEMRIVEFMDARTRNIKFDIEAINQNELEVNQGKKGEQQQPLSIKFILKLKNIGLSFIQNTRSPFSELIFICFKGVELIALDKNRVRTYQIRLKNFVFNNNTSDFVRFPVVINSLNKNLDTSDRFLLNMICKRHLDSTKIEIFDSFIFDLEPLKLKIERNLLEKMIEYVEIISEILKKSSNSFQTDIFQQQGPYIIKLNKNEKPTLWDWEQKEHILNYNQIFFQEIIIAPIFLNLTFVNQVQKGEFKLNPLSMLLNSMLSAIANLEDVKLKLTGVQLFNCTDTQEGIVSKMETHYKQNIAKELFTTLKIFDMIGHADFIGNPIGLFQNISTGFADLIEKPAEGFVKGPLEGGKGIFEGAGSFAQKTFTGTFNTVKVITGSLSTGIASLSQDQEFLQEREKKKLKEAKHVGQGLTQGAESILSGVGQGISGLFMKPFEGTKKDGVKGLFTGAFKGVTGLFVKPITGVLDAASKTAEGVKNTAYIFDKEKEDLRERDPRIFYGFDKFYDSYNGNDIEAMRILKKKKKGRFAGNCFFGFKKYQQDPHNQYMMIFTLETLINYNCGKDKMEWYISVLNIKAIAKTGGGLKIFLKEQDKKLKLQETWTKVDNEIVLNEIVERTQFLVEMQARMDEMFI